MLPTLLTLANLYSLKYSQYQEDTFPSVHSGVHSNVIDRLRQPFDFIVVGSGFSGSFLARKLSASGCHRVLLLEAGGMPSFDAVIPFLSMGNMSKVTWNFYTVPQKNAAKAMKEEKIQLMVAKTLGGNSVIDSGVYLPANLDDFHRWSYTYQLPGWSYSDMKKYVFELNDDSGGGAVGTADVTDDALANNFNVRPLDFKNQSNIKLSNILDESFHQKIMDPMKFVWLRAAKQLRYPIRYGEEQDLFNEGGFFLPRTLSVKGVKMNPAAHFLKDIGDNLMIICHAAAERLIFDADGRAVKALELRDLASGQLFRADVTKEIILAAGAIGSAKILLQSGIGPADHLANEGVPLFRDLPVGSRLNDRVKAHLMIKVHPVALESMKSEINDPVQMQTYLLNGTGILANTSVIGAAYVKTGYLPTADLMLELKPGGLVGPERMQQEMNLKDEAMEALDPDGMLSTRGCLEFVVTLLRPFSQGTMWMWRHKNESATPRMNPGYLTDERDITALVQGAKYAEAIIETDLFKEMGAEIVYPRFVDCPESLAPVTEDYWRCVMRHIATSANHLTSTVPFGDVIDNRLKVKGVQGVRVVDESVFPESATGGVASSLLALANRAYHLMNEELRLDCSK